MANTSSAEAGEWVKKLAAVYIASYARLLRAKASASRKSSALRGGRERFAVRTAKLSRPLPVVDGVDRYAGLDRNAAITRLRDGELISVRAVGAGDKERVRDHFARLGAESLYYRFLGARGALSDDELDHFTRLDNGHAALAATLSGNEDPIVGFAQYVRVEELWRAQIACSVLDEYQGRGIGSFLLDLLSKVATINGIAEFEGDALADNHRVLRMLAKSGRQVRQSNEAGVVHIYISLRPTQRPAYERRSPASHRPIAPGASRNRRDGIGGWMM
ncbi:MAG: GNAT family N-acetyltransferase [Candidatus Binataceae bacterium]|jgi:GNAT superfamily N-acetyltransferase